MSFNTPWLLTDVRTLFLHIPNNLRDGLNQHWNSGICLQIASFGNSFPLLLFPCSRSSYLGENIRFRNSWRSLCRHSSRIVKYLHPVGNTPQTPLCRTSCLMLNYWLFLPKTDKRILRLKTSKCVYLVIFVAYLFNALKWSYARHHARCSEPNKRCFTGIFDLASLVEVMFTLICQFSKFVLPLDLDMGQYDCVLLFVSWLFWIPHTVM